MSNKQKTLTLAFITVFFWASSFPLTKIVQEVLSPYSMASVRCLIASILLLILGKFLHIRKPKKEDIMLFALSGACGFGVYLLLFNTGLLTLTSATSSIIIAITPIITAVIASFFYNEKINIIGWICICAAFSGVLVLLLWDGVLSINVGMIWTLCAAFIFCGYNIANRILAKKGYTSVEIVTYSILSAAIMLAILLPRGLRELSIAEAKHIFALIYLAAVPSALSFILWGKALNYAERTSEVTNFMFFTPLLSTIMGFIFLKEMPNMGTFLGGTIIITSIVIFNFRGKKSSSPTTTRENDANKSV